jgi:hypothetical protein
MHGASNRGLVPLYRDRGDQEAVAEERENVVGECFPSLHEWGEEATKRRL